MNLKKTKKIITCSPNQTKLMATEFAINLSAGSVLALNGDLGSGKTHFVQGLAAGLKINDESYVCSPSFTLVNEYKGKIPVYHIDFYRLKDNIDLDSIGIEEYIYGNGITIIEWANKFPHILPNNTIQIDFKILGETKREIKITAI